MMNFIEGLNQMKNTPIVLHAKFGIKLKVNVFFYFPGV